MDMILAIFTKLGADLTIVHQFVVVVFLFILFKIVFLDKLLFVLDLRESKTTKLEHEANEKFATSEKLAEKYNKKMSEVINESQKALNLKKEEINSKNQQLLKAKEKVLSEELDAKRAQYVKEMEGQKDAIFSAKEEISKEIINKIIG